MTVDQIVTGAQTAIGEPGHVTVSERARPDRVKVLVPGNQVAGLFTPKFGRIFDGFLVEGLVL
jgi:hypothetical protein